MISELPSCPRLGGSLPLAAAVLLLSGCLSARNAGRSAVDGHGGAAVIQPALRKTGARPAPAAGSPLEARPVADLSGVTIGLPRFFVGVAVARGYPEDSTLESCTLYDFNMVYDISSELALETLFGVWDIPDRPFPGAGSSLDMRPLMAALQWNLAQGSRWRAYVAGGGGWGFNEYELGRPQSASVLVGSGSALYSVEVDDGLLVQFGGGVELYSSAEMEVNIGLELRYVAGEVDVTERLDTTTWIKERDINLWLLRANLSWHF